MEILNIERPSGPHSVVVPQGRLVVESGGFAVCHPRDTYRLITEGVTVRGRLCAARLVDRNPGGDRLRLYGLETGCS